MFMVVSDGLYYGVNIKMMGVGNYKVIYYISELFKVGLYCYIDSEIGVGCWWKFFDVSYDFKYIGLN